MTEIEQLQSQIDDLRDENEDLHRALQDATQLLNFYEDCFGDILYVVKKVIRGV